MVWRAVASQAKSPVPEGCSLTDLVAIFCKLDSSPDPVDY
jgi:hypothetical protein